jgi:hypothetical protein
MIGCVFHAVDHFRLERLIGIGQFFDALFISIGYVREALRVSGLTGTVGSNLSWVCPQVVETRFIVAVLSFHHDLSSCSFGKPYVRPRVAQGAELPLDADAEHTVTERHDR